MEKVEFKGDNPSARFGHTITPIGKDKAILFGGAVGDTGKYVITGDTYLCDYSLLKWKKLDNHGSSPTNRAAHNSISVDHFFYVFGGALGGGELADDNLYQFDFLTLGDKANWEIKNCKGTTPGARYGHVMAYLKPYVIIYGGNTGSQAVGDIWKIDVTGACIWQKVNTGIEVPPSRVYHSASICRTGTASGMMVIFGGRGQDGTPLNDTWGLRKHRDGRLDWMKAPYRNNSKPTQRYQHRSMFVGTLLLIIGGRSNQVGQSMPLDIYDTDSSDWYKLPSIDRFRHISFMVESDVYIHGGFDQEAPNIPTASIIKLDLKKYFGSHRELLKGVAFQLGKDDFFNPNHVSDPKIRGSKEHQKFVREKQAPRVQTHQTQRPQKMQIQGQMIRRNIQTNRAVRLCSEGVAANFQGQDIKKISIDILPMQHRKLTNLIPHHHRQSLQKVHNYFINNLFLKPNPFINYPIPNEYIKGLLQEVEKILDDEPMFIRMRAPVKVFGDIHGQIHQLNRFFQAFGAPIDEPPFGDIECTNYVFMGDYVDRGNKSVETILLLFALKIKFPENIFLLRGAHEDRQINKYMGFGDQCALKFKENIDDQYSFFSRVNRLFDKLPVAALLQDCIFCCHGGIGHTLKSYYQLDKLQKPLRVNHDPKTRMDKIVYELLWADPCRPGQQEHTPNHEHDYFRNKVNTKFSQDRTSAFCNQNDLMTIVRSNEPMFQGFEFKDSLITVFSCSDYGGHNNKSSILHMMKSKELIPKILNGTGGKDRWMAIEEYGSRGQKNEENRLRQLAFTPPKR